MRRPAFAPDRRCGAERAGTVLTRTHRLVALAAAGALAAGALALVPREVVRRAAATRGDGTIADTGVPARDPVRIMPLGDSITWGTSSPQLDGWRRGLRGKLGLVGVPVDFVGSRASGAFADNQHEGRPGWRIDNARRDAPRLVRSARPDVILLHLGTNDVKLPGPYVAAAPARLGYLLDDLLRLAPRATILVARVANSPRVDVRARLARYNRALPAVAARRGPRVRVVNMATLNVFSDFADSLHPNRRGYAILAQRWYRALEPVLRGDGPAWPAGDDPQTARYRCAGSTVDEHRMVHGTRCRWWHLRTVAAAGGGPRRAWMTARVGRGGVRYWSLY
ncbi:SGNH/GDSL hydrolase family protein [Pilimelia anulata]|uniref:SGNH/GDSL hydrolase family protein n=1 Tax=Pilimelia anulata TaxID=53371 RepID=UPI001667FCD5|nr:SGNH/GDSL hydrolase family protein [Pilimelia anulata]